jgi:small subunit ribosomal protein S9
LAEAITHVATGKRKTAIARVYLTLGSGAITVNGKPVDDYFSREVHRIVVREPLEALDSMTRFDINASIKGGGDAGQAGALRHGISRALEKFDPNQRATLKPKGFLTRDPRKKERKKYGQRGARARFQFSKR